MRKTKKIKYPDFRVCEPDDAPMSEWVVREILEYRGFRSPEHVKEVANKFIAKEPTREVILDMELENGRVQSSRS